MPAASRVRNDAGRVLAQPARRARGFTLLEVMAAFALLAIAYTTLGGAGAQSLQKEGEAARRLHASLLADRVLDGLEAGFDQGAAPPVGEEESSEGTFRVAIRVAPWEPVVPERERSLAVERGEQRARRPGESIRDDAGASLGPSLVTGERGQPGPLRRVDVVVTWDEGWSEGRVARTTFGLDPEAAAASLEALGAAAAAGREAGAAGGSDASGLGGRIRRGEDRRQRSR
ncbi:MAG TPA: prepilin-type N-terminal cleavage/methylation domain-containing protein [Myxococcota bacterium]|nr:prepilin-type N-terminal cleavage/methylation domain-containing protein [Myxococcota bacterium]